MVIDKQGRIPIYEQIIDSIESDILNGFISENELIPSVRNLSMELSINPNTIQKAYNDLEIRGITYSVPGVGRYVSKEAINIIKNKKKTSDSVLKKVVEDLKLVGISLDTILDNVKKYYGEDLNND